METMEGLSINLNKCGGVIQNGTGEIYDVGIAEQMKKRIYDFLSRARNNIVLLNEVNNAGSNLKVFEKLFDTEKYCFHKPSDFETFNEKWHPYGCTIAIANKNSDWKEAPSIVSINRKSGEAFFVNKSVVLTRGDIILLGVHMPMGYGVLDYWDRIIEFFKANQDKKLYIVGDLNVFDEGTDRKIKFEELIGSGANDVWLKRGGDNDHVTCVTEKRLDYLLSSKAGYSQIEDMDYLDSFRTDGLTDHSGVYFRIVGGKYEKESYI